MELDPAMMQVQAARQHELETLAKKARADRLPLEQPWKDPRFFSIGPENVMFYFCQRENPFFDPNSDNAMILMQNQGIGPAQLDAVLKGMTGIQFALVEPASPPLFVIRKQQRTSPDKITPLCHFYVLDGTVYQAPDMHTLIHSRLVSMMDPLRYAFQEALSMLRFQPARGHFWEFRTRPARLATAEDQQEEGHDAYDDAAVQEKKSDAANPLTARATPYQNQRTHALLNALAQRFGGGGEKNPGGPGIAAVKPEKMEVDSPSNLNDQQQRPLQQPASTAPLISDFQNLFASSSSLSRQQQQPERE